MPPTISVIIPTYQCAEYVVQAVDSALSQRYPSQLVDIIVVNDGSTDNTDEKLRPYFSKIQYINQSNRGEAAARNVAIRASRGELVAFLDADDYWLPDRLRIMTEALCGKADRIVTSDFFTDIAGKTSNSPYYEQRGLRWVFDLSPAAQLKVALEDNFMSSFTIVPTNVFRQVGMFDESLHYGTDWDLFLRCFAADQRVLFVPHALGVYRLFRPGATTSRNDYAKAQDRVRVLARYRKLVPKYRWENAVGLMHHLAIRESLRRRAYHRVIRHAVPLLLNQTYIQESLSRRRMRKAELRGRV